MWDKLALILLVIGGVNWGLVGIFEFDLVGHTGIMEAAVKAVQPVL